MIVRSRSCSLVCDWLLSQRRISDMRIVCWVAAVPSLIIPLISLDCRYPSYCNTYIQSTGLAARSSVFKTRRFWSLLSYHLRFRVSFNLQTSQPKNPVTPPLYTWSQIILKCDYSITFYYWPTSVSSSAWLVLKFSLICLWFPTNLPSRSTLLPHNGGHTNSNPVRRSH